MNRQVTEHSVGHYMATRQMLAEYRDKPLTEAERQLRIALDAAGLAVGNWCQADSATVEVINQYARGAYAEDRLSSATALSSLALGLCSLGENHWETLKSFDLLASCYLRDGHGKMSP